MTADARDEPLAAIARADAEAIAALVHLGGIGKAVKARARAVLWRAFEALEPARPDGDDDVGPMAAPPDWRGLALELEFVRTLCGDRAPAGVRRLQSVRIARPFPDRIRAIPSSVQTDHLARRVAGRFRLSVALTAERLAWFEARSSKESPTHVATVRQPDTSKESRDSLELLVRAGRSKFS
ncbi:MAG: hypothetical protein EXR79_00645 [Myxococcales bacterium]|nr:hypothetical protein [Myxococcales bacterium]